MIINLFSIFDPRTPNLLRLNWLYILFILGLSPFYKNIVKRGVVLIWSDLRDYLKKEFSPLLVKAPSLIIWGVILFIFIICNNTRGLAPYVFTRTSHLVVRLGLALPLWLRGFIYSWSHNISYRLRHLVPPGCPIILIPLLVIIELIRRLIRPITLSVRLAGNIVAGHLLIRLLRGAHRSPLSLINPLLRGAQILLRALELAVTFIQAYVFRALITLYIAESLT